MKKIFFITLSILLAGGVFAQSRRQTTTMSNASQREPEIRFYTEPNYEPVVLKLGQVFEEEAGVAYVKIKTKYSLNNEGDYYFYACNLKAEVTAMLSFRTEEYAGLRVMDIFEGMCEKGDYVYMRFVPKIPEDV